MTDRPGAAYIDATAGVAGDMLLAALLDAGADVERVSGAIASLGVPGLGLRTEAAPASRLGSQAETGHAK